MFALIILALLTQVQVFGYDVSSWLKTGSTSHVYFTPNSLPKNRVERQINAETGTRSFKVICEEFDIDDPRIRIFTNEGLLLETGTIISSDPCSESQIASYVVSQESQNEKLEMVYLIEGKTPICVKRSYSIATSPTMARVHKSSYPVVPCPTKVNQFIGTQSTPSQAGGLVSLGPTRMHVFNINQNVKDKKKHRKDFPTKDLQGKTFAMICDKLQGEGSPVTATIVHQDWPEVVIDEFKIDNCELDFININRQIFHNTNLFKTVFRTPRGICYEREYKFYEEMFLFYYNVVTIERKDPEKVHCPKKFTGDIGENIYEDWYVKLIPYFSKAKPYAVVVSNE